MIKDWDIGIDSRTAEGRSEGVDIAGAADGKGLFTAGRTPFSAVELEQEQQRLDDGGFLKQPAL